MMQSPYLNYVKKMQHNTSFKKQMEDAKKEVSPDEQARIKNDNDLRLNSPTMEVFKDIWRKNARINLTQMKGKMKSNNIIDLINWEKKAIVVCGSGYSLKNNIDLLKKYRDDIIIFSCDSTFTTLYKEGIIPDLVINIDPTEYIKDYLVIPEKKKINSVLLMPVTSPYTLWEKWPGKVMYYKLIDTDNKYLNEINDVMYPNIIGFFSKYNVGEFALALATFHILFKNVAFVGMDYCLRPDGRYYDEVPANAPNPTVESNRRVLMMDTFAHPVYTDPPFVIYAKSFEASYKHCYSKYSNIFNLSEGIIPLTYAKEEFIKYLEE